MGVADFILLYQKFVLVCYEKLHFYEIQNWKFSEPHNAVSYSNAMFPYGFEFAEIFEFGEKKPGPHYFQLKMMI